MFTAQLIDKLVGIKAISDHYVEDWASLSLKGQYDHSIFQLYHELSGLLTGQGQIHFLRLLLDNDEVTVADIDDYEQSPNSFYQSTLLFNKQGFLESNFQREAQYHNFFLTAAVCKDWLDGLNPVDGRNPINKYSPLVIYVHDLTEQMGSDTFQLRPLAANTQLQASAERLPTFGRLQESIHFIADFPVSYNPNAYAFGPGIYTTPLGESLLKLAEIGLSVSVVDEFYSFDKVILNGLKRLPLKVGEQLQATNHAHIDKMIRLVAWLYEDRVNTRKKLFNERLTLEIDESVTLLQALRQHADGAWEQAKERYNFVILDRKDAYVKELKELLKDLRTQSDLYSTKIRTLLSNFLRDLLATLVLIGFTIFTKFTDNIGLDKHQLLYYVFDGLGIYFILSIIFQAAVDITDLRITTTELLYWKKAAKELISENEFNTHYKISLEARKTSIWIIYPLIAVCYFAIAYLCFKYPSVIDSLLLFNPKK
ncbi:hypothetical protein FHW88_004931 [Mucilaginibacter sp. SG538B]|uniref:hypothetical protein n=1 Tax=Mucilaginibacter sp. SG538B TaxID=2587021 RepID=UPI00159EB4A1|nr:hypothetical protein [Mucilaginibacter sp. SG538B]NVM66613.1 hypothetical protein [Mucilaginibacter sp. SG538B]